MAPIQITEEAKRAANLRVLQKSDQSIVDIVGSATHVVLYEFNAASKQWEKRNVEGSLFVTKRSDLPRFKIIVMNRNAKENLEVPLAASFQMQVREPYLIFRLEKEANANDQQQAIMGIWFHDGKERQKICSVLENVVKSLSAAPPSTSVESASVTAGTKQSVEATSPPASSARSKISNSEAAASLMATLKIGSGSVTSSNPREKQQEEVRNGTPLAQHPDEEPHVQNIVLDKKSLQLSLMSLLQEDKFLDLIHAQYLKVARARAKANSTPKNDS